MLGMILPANVESEERFGEAPGGALFPEEEKIIAHAVEARRREFATVRVCARACLARLGYAQVRSCLVSVAPLRGPLGCRAV